MKKLRKAANKNKLGKTAVETNESPEQVDPLSALAKMKAFVSRREIFVAAIKKSKN